ncbi:MAG: hypothetical protein JJU02_04035 [Cryomorphaceae bacterium]|nr:hypothetical protein [Cryomorphaceae bacterium]
MTTIPTLKSESFTKRSCFVLMLLMMSVLGYGQKCKYDFNIADPFSGQVNKGIKSKLAKSWKTTISSVDDTAYYLTLHLNFPGQVFYLIEEGDSCIMVLDNGKQIILHALEDVKPKRNIQGYANVASINTFYTATYKLEDEQLAMLSSELLSALRIYFQETPITVMDFPKRNRKKILKAAGCIAKKS